MSDPHKPAIVHPDNFYISLRGCAEEHFRDAIGIAWASHGAFRSPERWCIHPYAGLVLLPDAAERFTYCDETVTTTPFPTLLHNVSELAQFAWTWLCKADVLLFGPVPVTVRRVERGYEVRSFHRRQDRTRALQIMPTWAEFHA